MSTTRSSGAKPGEHTHHGHITTDNSDSTPAEHEDKFYNQTVIAEQAVTQ